MVALTEEQIAQRMNQVDMAVVNLIERVFDAIADNPSTPEDESKVDFLEGLALGGYVTTVLVPGFYQIVRDLDGASKEEILAAYKSRMTA